MGRAVLCHLFSISTNSPRFPSPFARSCSLARGSYAKRCGAVPPVFYPRRYAEGFRCLCTVSIPQTDVPEASKISSKKRVVSGVQPTGSVHLGNYLGAIKNWTLLQDTYETLFFIVDLHAITLPYDASELAKATRDTAAIYLACGVDPSKASVFVQSHVRAHVELMWLLSAATPVGRLNRMIQFKEKSRKAVRCHWR